MVTPLRIAARLHYATLDELEAGFAERLAERDLFLAHGSFESTPEEPRVGAAVTVEIATASGEAVIALEGVVAWCYPPSLVPPGREPGAGIHIERFHDGSEERAARIRKRAGSGTRVRVPGTRLKPPAIERLPIVAPAPRRLPASLLEVGPPPAAPSSPPVEPAPSVPAPRLMGLALDQTFDPTPAPGPVPLPREDADVGLPPPPVTSGGMSAAVVSLDALPDLPSAAPTSAFEQVPTDVDLLRSVEDADLLTEDPGAARDEHRALADVAGPRGISQEPAAPPAAAPGVGPVSEPEEVDDEDVSPVDEDSTGSHAVPLSALPSVDAADFHTAEHQAVAHARASSHASDWEGRTEHGLDPSEPTAEASDPDRTVLPARPLPDPSEWPETEDQDGRPIGVAFVVARRAPEPVGLEVLTWPTHGTKRMGALDEAREQGGERLDEAIASAPWLSRDASAAERTLDDHAQAFDAGLTDPGRHVVDVVGAMVRASADEPDGGEVFQEPLREAHAHNPALEEPTVAEDPPELADLPRGASDEDATRDEAAAGVRAAPPLLEDDEQATDRDLRRPPTETSADTRGRLGVLQRFLGKR